MALNKIIVKGARENNLKNIDIELPKEKLIVFTGLSGSGKSSLAFNTIYAEGERRYIESLSSFSRQFLKSVEKPDVDDIEGLSPAISIDQKTTSHNPRSTVGTTTEIHDHLRILYSAIGKPFCINGHGQINSQSITEIVNQIQKNSKEGDKLFILSPKLRWRNWIGSKQKIQYWHCCRPNCLWGQWRNAFTNFFSHWNFVRIFKRFN
jgi:excinuclease ABC subunit A